MEIGKLESILKSKKKGIKFVNEAMTPLVTASVELKWLEKEKEEATHKLKETLKTIEEPFKTTMSVIKDLADRIRERIMEEYGEREAIKKDGIGELVFPMVQSIEVEDLAKVDRKYLMVDMGKVREDVKKGVTKIKGIKIGKTRTMQVRPWKEEQGKE